MCSFAFQGFIDYGRIYDFAAIGFCFLSLFVHDSINFLKLQMYKVKRKQKNFFRTFAVTKKCYGKEYFYYI